MRLAVYCALAIAAGISSGWAYTQDEADACTPDAFRLCAAHIPNERAIEACLRSNRSQLSRDCAAVFEPSAKVRDGRSSKRPAR